MVHPKRTSALLHGILAFAAVGLVALSMATSSKVSLTFGSGRSVGAAHIGVEHVLSLSLRVTAASGTRTPGVTELSQESEDTIIVSVPRQWRLREVRGATVDALEPSAPALDVIRWRLPAHATLSFFVDQALPLSIHNLSTEPLRISWKRVNLDTGEITSDTALSTTRPVTF